MIFSPSVQEDFNLIPFETGENLSITVDPIDPIVPIDPITTTSLLLNLSTVEDGIAIEGTESIVFELSVMTDKVTLGEYSITTILIMDIDGKYK